MILSFEDSEIRVVAPIDLHEGQRYGQPVHSEGRGNYLDQLYNIMSSKEYYINPTIDGKLSWQSVSSCTYDSGDALENWHNMLHEISTRKCGIIKRYVRRVRAKESKLPTYE